MASGAGFLTLQEALWGSEWLAGIMMFYFMLLYALNISFINIREIDTHEYKSNMQKSFFEFKRKVYFIFSHSGTKTVFSKKTFLLSIVGYLITLITIGLFMVSIFTSAATALVLLIVSAVIVFTYGIVVSILHEKAMKEARRIEKESWKKLNIDDDEE